MPALPRRAPLPAIVEQHAEEAAFLWLLRDRAVDAPHYAPRHLARLEERLEAHLDGLRVAGEVGFEIAMAQLDRFREPGEMFAAATLAFREDSLEARLPLVELAEAVPETRRGLFGALGWLPSRSLGARVRDWLDSAEPFERLLGTVACSLHRVDPNARLARLLDDGTPAVRARAMRLAGELGRVDQADRVAEGLDDPDEAIALWAAWSSSLLRADGRAAPILEAAAERRGRGCPALDALTRTVDPARVAAWIRGINGDASQRRLVVEALGQLGDPATVPWLLGRMADPELARPAGESFCLITGVDLAYDDLEGKAPESFEVGPTEAPDDERVALDTDENLPWPEPELIEGWWQKNGLRFVAHTRHLLGRAVDPDAAEEAFARGYQRQRRAAAYEIAALRPDSALPNWRVRMRSG
jgi:uncharacterized protein (TIGR02270 family)